MTGSSIWRRLSSVKSSARKSSTSGLPYRRAPSTSMRSVDTSQSAGRYASAMLTSLYLRYIAALSPKSTTSAGRSESRQIASKASASRAIPICRLYPPSPTGASAGGGGIHCFSVSAARRSAAARSRGGSPTHSQRSARIPSVGATISGVSAPSAAREGLAPRERSADATSRWSWKAARHRDVRPCALIALTFAPWSKRRLTTDTWPPHAASDRGV
mmetsp:Transcript_27062/g.85874  ORF Transcript_27062/g.85874 Transcript_27062/m.85874 type:complete len:216 (+) Transcript_27062:436-1083(+)